MTHDCSRRINGYLTDTLTRALMQVVEKTVVQEVEVIKEVPVSSTFSIPICWFYFLRRV